MSGPKTSRYTLTPEQRRILAEQRKIEQRKAVAAQNIKRNSKKLIQIGSSFNDEAKIASELSLRTGNDGGFSSTLQELEKLVAPVQDVISKTDYDNLTSVENADKAISESMKKAEALSKKIKEISVKNKGQLNSNLQEAIEGGFSASFANITRASDHSAEDELNDAISQLLMLKGNGCLSCELIKEIEDVIASAENVRSKAFVKNFISVSVNPLVKKANEYIAEYEECKEEFEALYSEYLALCELHYYVAQEYVCSRVAIETLKENISRINELVAYDDEQEYISECIDEVMMEMRYSVIGSRDITKKNGNHFRNELYSYEEGTAVSITYSSDGKIAMELGGLDGTDRIPNQHETELLCDSMEHFCGDFKEIEKKLLEKGVIISDRISLLPPSADYAQIINTNDYEMAIDISTFRAKKKTASAKKLKSISKE